MILITSGSSRGDTEPVDEKTSISIMIRELAEKNRQLQKEIEQLKDQVDWLMETMEYQYYDVDSKTIKQTPFNRLYEGRDE